jgi:SAM-dependent methyltransferase
VTARYTYGDSELAGDRLELVARLFEPASTAFVRAVSAAPPTLALDLGCGPGVTTSMVHRVTGATRTVGLDRSPAFVRRARSATRLGFAVADVVNADLPTRPASLIYARLLLAHLSDPAAVLARWGTALAAQGRLLIDDLESIDADGVFRTYLDEVALAVIRAQGGSLFVGPALHRALDPVGLARAHDEVVDISPAAADTARVFAMNLRVLSHNGEVDPRPELAEDLEAIASGERASAPVRWRFRQIAWERTG